MLSWFLLDAAPIATPRQVWEERISQEFDAQAKEEESLGLPVMPFMQNLSDGVHRSKLQVSHL